MSLRLYVAGASAEIDAIEPRIARLRAAWAEITHDWVADVRAAGTANVGLTTDQRKRYAQTDLNGILRAEVVWLLVPSTLSKGCWIELGIALGQYKRIVVSDDDEMSIFTALASEAFATHDEAEAYLVRWIKSAAEAQS